jgi:hypothetical protein
MYRFAYWALFAVTTSFLAIFAGSFVIVASTMGPFDISRMVLLTVLLTIALVGYFILLQIMLQKLGVHERLRSEPFVRKVGCVALAMVGLTTALAVLVIDSGPPSGALSWLIFATGLSLVATAASGYRRRSEPSASSSR